MPKMTEYEHRRTAPLSNSLREYGRQAVRGIGKKRDKALSRISFRCRTVADKLNRRILQRVGGKESILIGAAGLLASMAQLPQKVYPFAAALLAALTVKEQMLSAWIGASVGALFAGEQRFALLAVYFLLYVTRKAFTDSAFSEKLGIRMTISGASAVVCGAVRLLIGREMRSYALIGTLMSVIASIGATYLFAVLFDRRTAAEAGTSIRCVSTYAFAGMLVLSLGRVVIFGVRTDVIAACLLTMLYAAGGGFMHAGIVGFVCGLACGDPVLCAALGLAGIVCALLYPKNVAAAFVTFGLCMIGCTLYGGGVRPALYMVPEVLCAAVLLYPVIGIWPDALKIVTGKGKSRALPSPTERLACRSRLTDALFSVSELFDKLSEKQRLPSLTDVGVNVEKALADVCAGCALSEMCFAKKQTPLDELVPKIHAALSARPLENRDFGEQMLDKCIRLDALCAAVNRLYMLDADRRASDDRPALLASGYASMARMVAEMETDEYEAAGRDTAFEKAVARALTNADIPFKSVIVRSARDKRTAVHGVDPARVPFGTDELIRYLYAECGIRVGNIAFDMDADGEASLTFARAPLVRMEYASATRKRANEDVNGDHVSVFEGSRGRMYALLCDGMGSGYDAAAASRLCASFLEKLCVSEIKRPLMLEMLNNALLSQAGEHFSTVDFMEADLLTGRCTFIKAGAAPTYIFRGSRLYKIASETPPVGILPSFTAESTRFDVQAGDWIFMITDGVLSEKEKNDVAEGDGVGELSWLVGLMKDTLPADPALVAAKLLETLGAPSSDDDKTAAVIRVCAAEV